MAEDSSCRSTDRRMKRKKYDERKEGNQTAKITEDSRCRCSNGKEWRCSRQALLSYNWCEHHFRLYNIRRAKARKDEKADSSSYYEGKPEEGGILVDMKRKEMDVRGGRSKSRGRKWADAYASPCANPDVKRQSHEAKKQEKRDAEFSQAWERNVCKERIDMNHCNDVVEKSSSSTKVSRGTQRIAEDSQCIRTNGKRWRCKQQALVGRKLCKHHLDYKHKNVHTGSCNKDKNGKAQFVAAKRKGLNLGEKLEYD